MFAARRAQNQIRFLKMFRSITIMIATIVTTKTANARLLAPVSGAIHMLGICCRSKSGVPGSSAHGRTREDIARRRGRQYPPH
jgi:hypothetical protein